MKHYIDHSRLRKSESNGTKWSFQQKCLITRDRVWSIRVLKTLISATSIASSVLALFFISISHAQEVAKLEIPRKENFYLFLLVGQSNMAGRGKVEAEDKQTHPRVLTLTKEGTWQLAADPIHFDQPAAGVGLGKTFGLFVAESDPNITVGLIPAAWGGSPISTWEPGAYFQETDSHPYDDAIRRAKIAMQQGTLKAILWHQGESDCDEKLAPAYQAKLERLIARFRSDLDAPDLPFLIGQLGQFENSRLPRQYVNLVNGAQIAVAKEISHIEFVTAAGLTSNGDNVHFDASSQREFGKRFAAAYLKTQNATTPSIPRAKP